MITYDEKLSVYKQMFHAYGIPLMAQIELYNLVGVLYIASKKKSPDIKLLDLFNKIVKKQPIVMAESFTERFCIQLEVLLEDEYFFKPTVVGMTAPQIIERILLVLNEHYVPF